MENKEVLNIDAIMAELDKEFEFEDEEQPVVPEEQEELEETIEELEEEIVEEEIVEEEPEKEEYKISEDEHRRNEAFAQLRKERDSLAESDAFLEKLASQYGLTKSQLMERFAEQANQKAAEQSGMKPEQYKKMQELEQRVAQTEEARARELFNLKAENFATKYSLNDNALSAVFREGYALGIDVTKNPDLLEVIYRSMNFDNAKRQGQQEYLEKTTKRKATSVGKTGTQGANVATTEEDWEKEIDAFLKDKVY